MDESSVNRCIRWMVNSAIVRWRKTHAICLKSLVFDLKCWFAHIFTFVSTANQLFSLLFVRISNFFYNPKFSSILFSFKQTSIERLILFHIYYYKIHECDFRHSKLTRLILVKKRPFFKATRWPFKKVIFHKYDNLFQNIIFRFNSYYVRNNKMIDNDKKQKNSEPATLTKNMIDGCLVVLWQ